MEVGKSKGKKGRSRGKGKKYKSHGKGKKIKNPRKLTAWYKKSILFELDYRKLEHVEGESRLKRLADGPKFKAISYNIYRINGFVFSTSQRDTKRVTQNSGVYMNAFTNYWARDRNYKYGAATPVSGLSNDGKAPTFAFPTLLSSGAAGAMKKEKL
ncbi:hypothetical protein IFM89_034441 [Coptis chinensis]|uniref:Uncharacterized protein n=1 Tax=Coptis chinensis TaxID=261450 RepID=A0A835J222_9MAGN|nr:hypothetical protein IFM89_034441 [Coptis chinensis]